MLLHLDLRQLRAEHPHGVFPVLVLAALRLAGHHHPCGDVGNADGGLRLVDMLPAGAGGAVSVHPQILRADLNLPLVLDIRHDLQGGKGGLAAAGGVEGADAYQPVDAGLAFQVAVGIFPGDNDGGGLDAGLVPIQIVDGLKLKLVALGPAHVHAVEHLAPVLGLGAAGPGVEIEDGVAAVILPGEQGGQTGLLQSALQLAIALLHLRQQGGVVLLDSHLHQGAQILPLGHKPGVVGQLVFQLLGALEHLLGLLQVVPKALGVGLLLQFRHLFFRAGQIQCRRKFLQFRGQGPQLLLIGVIFNNRHVVFLHS